MASEKPLTFTAHTNPIPKGRPRVTKRGTFTPKKTLACEAVVRKAAAKAMLEQRLRCFTGNTLVMIHCYRSNLIRADVDNQAKTILDGMIEAAYSDDWQVKQLLIETDVDREHPRIEVMVRTYQPGLFQWLWGVIARGWQTFRSAA